MFFFFLLHFIQCFKAFIHQNVSLGNILKTTQVSPKDFLSFDKFLFLTEIFRSTATHAKCFMTCRNIQHDLLQCCHCESGILSPHKMLHVVKRGIYWTHTTKKGIHPNEQLNLLLWMLCSFTALVAYIIFPSIWNVSSTQQIIVESCHALLLKDRLCRSASWVEQLIWTLYCKGLHAPCTLWSGEWISCWLVLQYRWSL